MGFPPSTIAVHSLIPAFPHTFTLDPLPPYALPVHFVNAPKAASCQSVSYFTLWSWNNLNTLKGFEINRGKYFTKGQVERFTTLPWRRSDIKPQDWGAWRRTGSNHSLRNSKQSHVQLTTSRIVIYPGDHYNFKGHGLDAGSYCEPFMKHNEEIRQQTR